MRTMSPLMRSECRKFAPNIFNKTKCSNCFRQKEEHSAEALESNRATRKACKCGYLFVAPDWDFSNPINRTKRWQRRWFVLYDDGELTYSVDEHPDTVPQAAISLIGTSGQGVGGIVWEAPESETGHPHSLAVAAPDRVHFVRGDSQEETRAWLTALLAVVSPVAPQGGSRLRQTRHKRNATFPGGRSNPLSIGVSQRAISGATAFSRQASPILRQRFNSCISPLHHTLPSDNDKEIRNETHCSSSVVCNKSPATSSTSLPVGSSEALVSDSTDGAASVECHVMPRIRVSGDVPLSRSYFVDLPSPHSKGNDGTEVFSRSATCPPSSNERLSSIGSAVEPEVKIVSATRSFRNDVTSHGVESPKSSLSSSWRKQSPASDERHAPDKSISPVEKTVRGDPDGCVLDSMSSSSCCSVENERGDGMAPIEQIIRSSNAKDEISTDGRTTDNAEIHDTKDVSHQLSIKHGWLMKLGSSKEWSKHWFVLDGSGLLYYRDPSAEGKGILDGVIDLGLVSDIKETTVERNHGIQLVTWDGKQSVLSAVTPGIRVGWIAALRKAANLPPLPQKNSLPQPDPPRPSCDISVGTGSGGSVSPKCSVNSHLKTVDNSQQSCSELLNLMSSPVHMMFPPAFSLGIKEKFQSGFASSVERTCNTGASPSSNKVKGHAIESTAEGPEVSQNKSALNSGPLNSAKVDEVGVTAMAAEIPAAEDCVPNEGCKSTNLSNRILSNSPKFPVERRESEDCCVTTSPGSSFSTTPLSADSNQSTPVHCGPPPCLSSSCQVTYSRNTAQKPPVSPAISSSLLRATRRHSSSLCVRQTGSTSSDRSSMDAFVLERTSSDGSRPERPSFLPLKSMSNMESKCGGPSGYAPISYISSSASSCSLSDEDFRTASEASLHSTPMSELIVDNNCNSIMWAKSDVIAEKGEASNSYLATDLGSDLGSILPPSPPLNRTPISRVKERARSRVVRRSKTPPEENVQSLKIESLSKKVKELVAALAAKEAELKLKEKAAEESLTLAAKKRSFNGLSNSKAESSSQSLSDGKSECITVLRQNSEEEIASLTVLPNTAKFCEFEEGVQSPVATSMRRLSSSAGSISHALPRMGSLSDLTNVDLDLDVTAMDRERLIEEWCGLRARFEKAVREIHALRKELRACQGRVDALELESSATSMCLARERTRAEADMSLMVNRVQDLTVKLSAAEKQVRQLKQKASRVESREKRRSLSLRGGRDGARSGTDPSLGTAARLPKEISDRLSRLEACLVSVQSSHSQDGSSVKTSRLATTEKTAPSKDNSEDKRMKSEKVPPDGKIIVFSEAADEGSGDEEEDTVKSVPSSGKQCLKSEAADCVADPLETRISASSGGVQNLDVNSSTLCPEGEKNRLNDTELKEQGEKGKSGINAQGNVESCAKTASSCGSEQKRARVQGRRRQRLSSRLVRRGSEGDKAAGEAGGSMEEEVEEVGVEDESSKGCDPLRILVRLSSLEGRVADYLKSDANGKELPSDSSSPDARFPASNVNEVIKVSTGQLCPNCEKMHATIERMKKEFLVEKHAIGYPADSNTSLQERDGDPSMVERYREEIEQLRGLCEKGMRAMDASHQRVIHEMEEKHKEEVLRVYKEKEQALREETKATLAALDAMRKAHETEVQREVAKFKEEFTRRMSAKQELSSQHKAEMEGIRQEILSLSQRYSSKCLECASLREQLRLTKGMKSGERQQVVDLAAFGEVPLGHS